MRSTQQSLVLDYAQLRRGHFLLSSGMHSPYFLELETVAQDPELTAEVCQPLADRFREQKPQIILSVSGLDAIFAYELARQLHARVAIVEGRLGQRSLRQAFRIESHDRVLVVVGVIVTGDSARELIRAAEARGAMVIGVAVLVDRSGVPITLGHPIESLAVVDLECHHAPLCPLCAEGVPLEKRVE